MSKPLTPTQSAILFDVLTHHNTYTEIRDFRHPGSLNHYGPPFTTPPTQSSSSPSLQGLVSKFVLPLPGIRDVPDTLWKTQVHGLIQALEEANLSESYDKGTIGSRKTLATAISALIEYPVRGTTGGFPQLPGHAKEYDLGKAADLAGAFRDFMDGAIYGSALEDLVARTAETDRLEEHEPLTQAVHEFLLVNVASFMHYTLILSPKGQYLLKLLGNANKLVPYMVIRQTLRIGNVASMIGAMMRVVLAKMSVSAFTNWMGLTQTPDEGLNLMQQIISTVLHWDNKDLESRASKIEGDKHGPSKEQLACLKAYTTLSLEEQETIRNQSKRHSLSIVIAILASSELPTDLSDSSHKLALEYLSAVLSVRDRKEIIRVLCRSSPDHLTTTVRTMVNAYEPVIRNIHNAVDLSTTVSDLQAFLSDLLKMSKLPPPDKNNETPIPTVGDFVQLLKKHQSSCHKFIHQCCKNGKELTGWYLEWVKNAAAQFKRPSSSPDPTTPDAGALTSPLQSLFSALPPSQQETLLPILDAQTRYVEEMHASSLKRLDAVLRSPPSKNAAINKVLSSAANSRPVSRTASPDRVGSGVSTPVVASAVEVDVDAGPGAYLARWQDLLDGTALTPGTAAGKIGGSAGRGRPDVGPVVEALGEGFREVLAQRGVYW